MASGASNKPVSRAGVLVGTKVGMTRVFVDGGKSLPVTVIHVEPHFVTQIRTPERDGYAAVQVATGTMKPRNATIPMIGHDAKAGIDVKRYHREFRISPAQVGEYTVGQELTVSEFAKLAFVDVIGTSKGKGFQGGMKRHGFKGVFASHGTERKHRSPGSIGGHCSNRGFGGGLVKGKRMAGHMGDERVTERSMTLVRVDAERGLLLVHGSVPGATGGVVEIRPAIRLFKSKAVKQAASVAA